MENRAELLTTEEVLKVEEGSSQYLQELLIDPSHSAIPRSTDILSTHVSAMRQEESNNFVILESEIRVSSFGVRGLSDLSSVFMFLVGRNNTNSVYETLDALIDIPEMRLDMVSFTDVQEFDLLLELDDFKAENSRKYSKTERSLIITTTVLSVLVVALSAILIWIAGGWLALRKQVKILIHREEELTRMTKGGDQNLRQGPTASESDDEESPPEGDEDKTRFTSGSGILGVNPYYGKQSSALDGLGIKMTPARKTRDYDDMDSEVQTPMSEMTSYSDTNRAPIGIMSMRKLMPGATADQNQNAIEDDRNTLGNFAMKRLDF